MNIEIHQPRLEALIQQRMASGRFESIEDLLLHTFDATDEKDQEIKTEATKENLSQFLRNSPLWGSELTVERQKDLPRPVEL